MDEKNDQIRPLTRWVAAAVFPILWLAFLILYFLPDATGERFAWLIRPHMTSLYMGAGYLGGSWLFIHTAFGKRWHRVQAGFPAVTFFTWAMLAATLLHWDRFSHGRLGFTLWLILYIITPVLVPALWLSNRGTDPGRPEEDDQMIPGWMSLILRLIGAAALVFAFLGLVSPSIAIKVWPWTLTPLTARVMSGWIGLLGVGSLVISAEKRWSGWRVPMQSIFIWHVLVLVAAVLNRGDFTAGLLNWYTLAILFLVAGVLFILLFMESRRLKSSRRSTPVQL